MKQLFCTLTLIISLAKTQAQPTFAPIGATWVYKYSDSWGGGPTCYIKSIRDTSILGKQCKITSVDNSGCQNSFFGGPIYSENGRVYFYMAIDNQFHLLYDINKNVGSHFATIVIYSNDSIEYIVDSVSTITINGYSLKRLKVHSTHHPNNLNSFGTEIIENIGFTSYMFPWGYSNCNEFHAGPLGCYSDSIIGFYSTGKIPDCTTNAVTPPPTQYVFKIYPNPNGGNFALTIDSGVTNLNVYNTIGQLIQSQSYSGVSTTLNLELITKVKGIYFLQVQSEKNTTTKKIIVE